jgi:cysteine synthase A
VKGYRLILVMPDSMSIERRRLMLAYGARFELTPREKGMNGSIARAQELVAQTPGAWMPQQFENPANVEVHARTTAKEILADFPDGLDALITGVGTGGHITGCAQVLKRAWPKLKVFSCPARPERPNRNRRTARENTQSRWNRNPKRCSMRGRTVESGVGPRISR